MVDGKIRMKKKIFAVLFAFLLIIIAFSGCVEETKDNTQEDSDRFIGTWKVESPKFSSSTEMIWSFYENGTVKMVTYSFYSWGPGINVSSDDEQKTLTVTGVDQNYTYENTPIIVPYYSSPYVGHVNGISSIIPWRNIDYKYIEWATYQTKDSKLYIEPISYQSSTSSYFLYPYGAEYEFSNDSNYIIIALIEYPVRLTKTSDLTILKWEDIHISLNGAYTVYLDWIKLARSSISYSGDHAPSEWGDVRVGDVIEFGKYNSSISVTLTWQPSGKILGTWHFTKIPETLYVCGTGSQNYTKIQDAIDNASDGDTIFVYNGTYHENIQICDSISLIGENKNTTIIEGVESNYYAIVFANVNKVKISGFTIQYEGESDGNYAIEFDSDNCVISNNNVFANVTFGIGIYGSGNLVTQNTVLNTNQEGIALDGPGNNVSYNYIENSRKYGISLDESSYNNIYKNIITKCETGIYIRYSSLDNNIHKNKIANNSYAGVYLYMWTEHHSVPPENNTFYNNSFENNSNYAVRIKDAPNNYFYSNNFINSGVYNQAFANLVNYFYNQDLGEGNYWDDYSEIYPNAAGSNGIWGIPYNITGGNNHDLYPLMNPVHI
jgi:parallel beta-helix repeat protein